MWSKETERIENKIGGRECYLGVKENNGRGKSCLFFGVHRNCSFSLLVKLILQVETFRLTPMLDLEGGVSVKPWTAVPRPKYV